MDIPDSIFCVKLGGTGGIKEPEVNAYVSHQACSVTKTLLWFDENDVTWSKSKRDGWEGFKMNLRHYNKFIVSCQ